MIAQIEMPDGSYESKEMGNPECGDFCDDCGDCLCCYEHNGDEVCPYAGVWVIYLSNPKNPFYKEP
jgi:hypothetical protein